jgi:hypothetical protein
VLILKICVICKREFEEHDYRQLYCSEECRVEHYAQIRQKKNFENMNQEQYEKLKSLADRQQDAHDFIKLKDYCEVCGKTSLETRLVFHEVSYSPLEYVTLCYSCHSILHVRFLRFKRVKPRPLQIYPLAISIKCW